MRFVPPLFVMGPKPPIVSRQIDPDCAWVNQEAGVAPFQKWQGEPCLVAPEQADPDTLRLWRREIVTSGQRYGHHMEVERRADDSMVIWRHVTDVPEDLHYREAWAREADAGGRAFRAGTYELCGPMIRGNLEELDHHYLVPHTGKVIVDAPSPVTWEGMRQWCATHRNVQGIVWHGQLGKMAQVDLVHFGVPRVVLHRRPPLQLG